MLAAKLWFVFLQGTVKNVFVKSGSANDHSSSAPSTPSSVDRMVEETTPHHISPSPRFLLGSISKRAFLIASCQSISLLLGGVSKQASFATASCDRISFYFVY